MLSADWSDGVRWGPIGSDWVPMGSDVARLGPMGSDWVISHTGLTDVDVRRRRHYVVIYMYTYICIHM